jgi:hypothetical protein
VKFVNALFKTARTLSGPKTLCLPYSAVTIFAEFMQGNLLIKTKNKKGGLNTLVRRVRLLKNLISTSWMKIISFRLNSIKFRKSEKAP